MKSKQGKLIIRAGALTPDGREQQIEVRRGAKGRVTQVGKTITYWPWSGKSEAAAFMMAAHIARRAGLELVSDMFED